MCVRAVLLLFLFDSQSVILHFSALQEPQGSAGGGASRDSLHRARQGRQRGQEEGEARL